MTDQNNSIRINNMKRADKVALIIIWTMIAIIIEQVFLKKAGNELMVTIAAVTVAVLITGIAFLKINRFIKSLLIGLIPTVAILVVTFLNGFSLDRHYMLCMIGVIMALYFDKKLLLAYGGAANVLILLVYILRPSHLLGDVNTLPFFLSIFFMFNGLIVTLFFLTKWCGDMVGSVSKSKQDLQVVLDEQEALNRRQQKQAAYTSTEVQKLLECIDKLSRGELHIALQANPPDEDTRDVYMTFNAIAEKLLRSVESIRGYIGEVSSVLEQVVDGNLRIAIVSEYHGDFVALKSSINSIVGSLNAVMSDINVSSEQVAAGAKQLSDGSQAISRGAVEQAEAIDQLNASMARIASQTGNNAEKANEARELTVLAKTSADCGNERMKNLQNAMRAIDEAAENISKIIGAIDDIAFQTNILALNASVEAARAGTSGKGFAVVAKEVRVLAQRSADAARETAALIKGSVEKTRAGEEIANSAAADLADIVKKVEQTVLLAGDIARASNEQATAILQMNAGIDQMSRVVQSNSSMSQQTAAAAEELSGQADMLKNMVEQFALRD